MISLSLLLALCMPLACSFPLTDQTASEIPPCFLNDDEHSTATETLTQSLEKVNTRIDVLKYHVESHIQTINEQYCIDVSDEEIAAASFMDYNTTYADDQYNLCNDSKTLLVIMENTYETLNQLAGYFQHLRHTAIDNYSLKRLISTQGDIYDVMCSIKIAMKTKGQVPEATVPSENVSDMFVQYRQGFISRCTQQTSEYVTMLDSQRISKYLDTLLEALLAKILEC